MLALLDGNNFCVSCERVFRPSLVGRPVVCLSNNDGCAIARSNEAKALGIKMGQPWFEIRHLEAQGLVALSANFELYGDMSDRMMSLAAGLGHRQEVYSIDECFVDLSGIPGDLAERARRVRARIGRWLGLPVCIGLAPTKTLAKLANHIAKTAERKPGSYPEEHAGVCHLGALARPELERLMAATEVGDVWGVGRRIGQQLRDAGVQTVLDLARMDLGLVQGRWGIVLARTVRELQGMPCIDLAEAEAPRQQIACTRSFGQPVRDRRGLQQAVSEFATMAAQRLRAQGQLAGQVLVFAGSSPFRKGEPQYSRSMTLPLPAPTDDTRLLAEAADLLVHKIYRPGIGFARAGVILLELQPEGVCQQALDLGEGLGSGEEGRAGEQRLMQALDRINTRWGRGTLEVGAALKGLAPGWQTKRERLTPRYTTAWEELAIVRA